MRDPGSARAIAARIGRIALYTGVAAMVLALLGGEWVIRIIAGPEYLAAYWPMILLSAAAAIELAGATLEALLVSRGHALRNFLLRGLPTLAALLALPFALERAGAMGAAALVLAASSVTVLGLMLANREPRPQQG